MRRAISVVLFIVGAWLLVSGLVVAWIDVGEGGVAGRFGAIGIMALFSAPFLALGTGISPGNRTADLGMTLMVAAAVAGAVGLMMWLVFSDPAFRQLMPPDKPLPDFRIAPMSGLAGEIVAGAAGLVLWLLGRRRERRNKPDLQQIFGDG